jgi:rhomboid protease GluP
MKYKLHYNAPVTLTFSFIAMGVLLIGSLTQQQSTWLFFSVYRSSVTDPLTYFRVFSHVLGHATIAHLAGNLSIVLLLGPLLEEKYGSKFILSSMVITALITGVFQMVLFPNSILLGASGIVFMMILMSTFTNLKKGMVPITLILVGVLYLGQELFNGLVSVDSISQITHIIGGISGASLGYWYFKKSGKL